MSRSVGWPEPKWPKGWRLSLCLGLLFRTDRIYLHPWLRWGGSVKGFSSGLPCRRQGCLWFLDMSWLAAFSTQHLRPWVTFFCTAMICHLFSISGHKFVLLAASREHRHHWPRWPRKDHFVCCNFFGLRTVPAQVDHKVLTHVVLINLRRACDQWLCSCSQCSALPRIFLNAVPNLRFSTSGDTKQKSYEASTLPLQELQ